MKRVLAVIVAPPHLTVSGAARAAEQLSAALAGHCEMTVASMMGPQLPDAEQGGLRRAPVKVTLPWPLSKMALPNRYRTLFYRSDIDRLIRGGGFDLVHLHNPMPALELARLARACRQAGVPYVISTHGFNEIDNGARIYRFGLLRRLAWQALVRLPVATAVRGAAAIFVLSPADRDIARCLGFAGEAMPVVPNGVPMPLPADPAQDAQILQHLGLPERKPSELTCMFLANHTPNKGLPVLLESMSQLEMPVLLIVGGETRAEIDYGPAAGSLPGGGRIVVTGRLSDAEVAALFRRSDLFVFPTLADTFPLAILEAMSHGLPVLASRIGGIPHQIDDSCGWLVEAGDAAALARVLASVATDPTMLAPMGRRARARVEADFTWTSAASRALVAYQRLWRGKDAVQAGRDRAEAPAQHEETPA